MATKEKAEVKIHVANEIGVELENLYEAALKSEEQQLGASVSLADAREKVAALVQHLKQALDKGELKVDDLKPADAAVQVATRYVGLACALLERLAQDAKIARVTSAGMAAGFKRAMDVPKRMISAEQQKIEGIKAAEAAATAPAPAEPTAAPAPPPPRVVGQHPGNPLAARRVTSNGQKPPPPPKGRKSRAADA